VRRFGGRKPAVVILRLKDERTAIVKWFKDLIRIYSVIGQKLAHALYYREMKSIVKADHRFFASMYQIQRAGTENLTTFFKRLLPDLRIGNRSNIKQYGARFAYMSGCKPKEDFFVFAAQFGYGLICWGMVLGTGMQLRSSNDALQKMDWRSGGCGLGSQAQRIP